MKKLLRPLKEEGRCVGTSRGEILRRTKVVTVVAEEIVRRNKDNKANVYGRRRTVIRLMNAIKHNVKKEVKMIPHIAISA